MTKKRKVLLLIEDSPSTRMTYKRIFEDAGYEVLEAGTGADGWELTQSHRPDLVVLDLLLPDIHGLEVLRRIRSHTPTRTLPVLVLTTVQEAEEVQRTLASGASRYVHKGSVTPDSIVEIAEELLILKREET